MQFIFIGSGNKALSGYPETGILKGGGEQEHHMPVMERSSPARLNLPLAQDESKTLLMHAFFSRQKSGRNLTQRILEIDSTHISSKLECLRQNKLFYVSKDRYVKVKFKLLLFSSEVRVSAAGISFIGLHVHSSG